MRSLHFILLIVALFTVFTVQAGINDTITGTVTDAGSNAAINAVDVSSEGILTKTNNSGEFSLVLPTTSTKQIEKRVHTPSVVWNSTKGSFSWSGVEKNISIQVQNSAGVTVRSFFQKNEFENEFPVNDLAQGVYYVTIRSMNGKESFKVTNISGESSIYSNAINQMVSSEQSDPSKDAATTALHVLTFNKSGFVTATVTVASGTATNPGIQVSLTPSSSSADTPIGLEGFASLPYGGVATTTGGGKAAPDHPTSAAELATLASDATPRVIEITKSMEIGLVKINSNKTIIGIGPNVKLTGTFHIVGTVDAYLSNIIIRNLSIQGYGWHGDPPVGLPVADAGDCVSVMYAHHIWIDHCNIYDGPDGNLDITRGSDHVTISWCKFWFTQLEHEHRLSSLVGGGASESHRATDTGHLNTTWHHNWWAENVKERMPRYVWGKGHIYNNYYSSAGNNYCMRIGFGARVFIENNYFQNVREPYAFYNDSTNIRADGNIEENVKPSSRASGARGGVEPFPNPAPYKYSLDPTKDIPGIVSKGAGPQ